MPLTTELAARRDPGGVPEVLISVPAKASLAPTLNGWISEGTRPVTESPTGGIALRTLRQSEAFKYGAHRDAPAGERGAMVPHRWSDLERGIKPLANETPGRGGNHDPRGYREPS